MSKITRVIVRINNEHAFGRRLLRGIARYSQMHGTWMLYRYHVDIFGLPPQASSWNPDGVIVRARTVKAAEKFTALGKPVVILTTRQYIPDVPVVSTDDDAIGTMAAEHLLNLGFKNLAYFGYGDRVFWSRQRAESFERTVRKAGLKAYFNKSLASRSKYSWEKIQTALANWLKSLPKPLGLMACNDNRARDVVETYRLAGLKVPDELAIIGVDDDDVLCNMSHPPLSSVALNLDKAGYQTAELLDKLMSGKKPQNHTVIVRPTHVKVRQSTNVLAIGDSELASALNYIRLHVRQPICVDDVVDSTTLSRRVLEKRFRQILGRSIHQEIRRASIEKVAQMLIETNMSVSQIASAVGYPGIYHLARNFSKEKKMTPLAFRKKYGSR